MTAHSIMFAEVEGVGDAVQCTVSASDVDEQAVLLWIPRIANAAWVFSSAAPHTAKLLC
jgi:hypothetical protein